MHKWPLLGLLLLGLTLNAAASDTDTSLPLYYIEKPPYYFTHAQQPSGFLLARSLLILQTAGLSPKPRSLPPPRILHALERKQRPFCSVGWFKTPEREALAWFSQPIHHDAPMWLLVRQAEANRLMGFASFRGLLQAPYRIGLVDGFSYGVELDQLLQKSKIPNDHTAKSVQNSIQRLLAKRVDVIVADRLETSYLLEELKIPSSQLLAVRFADIPSGNARYLMCSKNLPEAQQQAINQAINDLAQQRLISLDDTPNEHSATP
ncbi:substrate-binding periplasmic protein [Atopomonas sediminilitoris]|uniref:substrate-binding periplasmic protein n=1 Tax=Atopomonas sediminilitoris TaxID=2919919 RepID=UPI001F4E59B8|nr:transporter substrate-binding domain-containing protein [Atopomonas sediminilitoris]MCJ8168474.1 transporter substrate-binding domain-containing protein [Atopomonas sediminilitoris]